MGISFKRARARGHSLLRALISMVLNWPCFLRPKRTAWKRDILRGGAIIVRLKNLSPALLLSFPYRQPQKDSEIRFRILGKNNDIASAIALPFFAVDDAQNSGRD